MNTQEAAVIAPEVTEEIQELSLEEAAAVQGGKKKSKSYVSGNRSSSTSRC